MSVDLYVYSSGRPLLRQELAESARRKGWHLLFTKYAGRTLVSGTRAIGNDSVYGTRTERGLQALQEALSKRRGPDRDDTWPFGVVGLLAQHPYDPSDELTDESLETLGRARRRIEGLITRARTRYEVRTSAGRTRLSSHLQDLVWKELGRPCGGLLFDPQSGEYATIGRGGKRVLHTPPDEALAPEQREVKAFVKEAQRRGFPVRAGWLQSSRLSIPQMEELSSLLKKTCSEAVAYCLASVLVEEFRDVKGSAFLKANRAWFERMQRRYDVSARAD